MSCPAWPRVRTSQKNYCVSLVSLPPPHSLLLYGRGQWASDHQIHGQWASERRCWFFLAYVANTASPSEQWRWPRPLPNLITVEAWRLPDHCTQSDAKSLPVQWGAHATRWFLMAPWEFLNCFWMGRDLTLPITKASVEGSWSHLYQLVNVFIFVP